MRNRKRKRAEAAERGSPRAASAWEWIERAHGRSGATDPIAIRGPGYSYDPHADGNERADDVITVMGPDGNLVHGPVSQGGLRRGAA